MHKIIFIILFLLTFTFNIQAQPLSSASVIELAPSYNLKAKISPSTSILEASGTLKLAPVEKSQESINLALSEIMKDFQIEVLQPAVCAGKARLEKKERPGSQPGWGTVTWTIYPSKPIPAGEQTLIKFSYTGGNQTSFGFSLGLQTCFAIGALTAWYPTLEEDPKVRLRAVKSKGLIEFQLPQNYKIHSQGKLSSSEKEISEGLFRFEIDKPVTFSFGMGQYSVFDHNPHNSKIKAYAYLLKPRNTIKTYLESSIKVIEVLSQEFGAYPYSDFAILELPAEQATKAGFEGANADGFIFTITPFLDKPFNTAFYGHEIGHQWWGGIIQKKGNPGAYMLDEALAQYGSLRAVEELEGAKVAECYRRVGYPGYYGEYSGSVYLFRALAGLDGKLSDLPVENGFLCRRISDTKGMLVYDMLSQTVGRKEFSKALHAITQKYQFQRISWSEFLQNIQESVGKDLGYFYEQWFDRVGAPLWEASWKQEGKKLIVIITQAPPYYQANIEIEVRGEDKTHLDKVEIHGAKTEFERTIDFPVQSVKLDPKFLVLHWAKEYSEEATALLPFTKADLKLQQGLLEEAEKEFRVALEKVPENDSYGLGFLLEYGLAQTLIELNKLDEAKTHLQASLASPTRRADILPFVYLDLAKLAKKSNDQVLLRWAINGASTSELASNKQLGAIIEAKKLLD